MRVLVLGDGVLMGATEARLHSTGLPHRLAEHLADAYGPTLSVDVLWDLGAAVQSIANLGASGRLLTYDAIVVVAPPDGIPAAGSRIHRRVQSAWPSHGPTPVLVVVLANRARSEGEVGAAESRVHDLAAASPNPSTPTVLRVDVDDAGAVREPQIVASAVLRALHGRIPLAPDGWSGSDAREVAVDRSLRALRGRTSDLRRALVLAQSTFDVPFAQLNLVSRGTLRSLAYIGRSSDGLQRTLSAEAVRRRDPLLIADTQGDPQFFGIPETHGPNAIRYYVGHPVYASSGHAIGVLCVLDTRPRAIEPGDETLIRDLALLAEGELAAITADS